MQTQSYSRRRINRLLGCLPALALTGCATSPSPELRTARSAQAVSVGNDIALFSLSLLDMPYVWGGRGPATGFDCSGLVTHAYREAAGIELRGNSASMAKAARAVNTAQLLAGDLLFFNTLGQPFSHVGIYVGDGRFVHASNERTGVKLDKLSSKYYAARFEGAKTVLG